MASKQYEWSDEYGDYSLVPVPDDEQHTLLNTFLVYSGVLAVIAIIAVGSSLGLQFNPRELAIVTIIGGVLLAVIGGLIATIGGITRLSTYVTMRYPFGYLGSWLWGLVISGIPSGLGWFAVETWLFGVTINAIAPNAFWSDVGVAAIWGGILMMLTAIYGYEGLSFLSYLAVPMFVLLAIAGFMVGLEATQGVGELFTLSPQNPGTPIAAGVTALVGSYIVGATIAMDIGRYSRKSYFPGIAWVIQIVFLMPLMILGAGIMTLTTGQTDFAQVMLAAGLGLGVFLMAIFGFWTTNDNNLYSGALSWSMFLPMKKKTITALEGIIGTAVAAYVGFSAGASMDPFIAFLTTLGKIIPAVAGVIIADFYVYRWWQGKSLSERYEYEPGQEFGLIVWPGWVAAVLGSWIGGWVITGGIGSLNVLVLAAVLHVALMAIADITGIRKELGSTRINETGRSPEIMSRIPGGGDVTSTREQRGD